MRIPETDGRHDEGTVHAADEPKLESDGFRRYNKWAGNPNGHKEDATCCIVSVTPNERGGFAHSHQCTRKRGHGPYGLYCKQHHPAEVSRRDAEAKARWRAKWDRLHKPSRLIAEYRKALEQIAAGHNDPRAVAKTALETD